MRELKQLVPHMLLNVKTPALICPRQCRAAIVVTARQQHKARKMVTLTCHRRALPISLHDLTLSKTPSSVGLTLLLHFLGLLGSWGRAADYFGGGGHTARWFAGAFGFAHHFLLLSLSLKLWFGLRGGASAPQHKHAVTWLAREVLHAID